MQQDIFTESTIHIIILLNTLYGHKRIKFLFGKSKQLSVRIKFGHGSTLFDGHNTIGHIGYLR